MVVEYICKLWLALIALKLSAQLRREAKGEFNITSAKCARKLISHAERESVRKVAWQNPHTQKDFQHFDRMEKVSKRKNHIQFFSLPLLCCCCCTLPARGRSLPELERREEKCLIFVLHHFCHCCWCRAALLFICTQLWCDLFVYSRQYIWNTICALEQWCTTSTSVVGYKGGWQRQFLCRFYGPLVAAPGFAEMLRLRGVCVLVCSRSIVGPCQTMYDTTSTYNNSTICGVKWLKSGKSAAIH